MFYDINYNIDNLIITRGNLKRHQKISRSNDFCFNEFTFVRN